MRHAHTHTALLGAVLLLALFTGGCASRSERAQQAADANAGVKAVIALLSQPEAGAEAISKALTALKGISARINAAADVPANDQPEPTMNAGQIAADPGKYAQTAPPEPDGQWAGILGSVAAVGASVLGAAGLIGRLFPGVPLAGPLASAGANLLWSIAGTKKQKQAEAVRDTLAEQIKAAAPLLPVAIAALPADSPARNALQRIAELMGVGSLSYSVSLGSVTSSDAPKQA